MRQILQFKAVVYMFERMTQKGTGLFPSALGDFGLKRQQERFGLNIRKDCKKSCVHQWNSLPQSPGDGHLSGGTDLCVFLSGKMGLDRMSFGSLFQCYDSMRGWMAICQEGLNGVVPSWQKRVGLGGLRGSLPTLGLVEGVVAPSPVPAEKITSMHVGCKVNAHGLQSQCMWVAKSMHVGCKVNAYGLQSQRIWVVKSTHMGCKVNVYGLQSQCIWVAKSTHMGCKVNAYGLQSQCIWVAKSMHMGCKVNACGLQSQCIWVAKSMHVGCKVNAYGLQSQCIWVAKSMHMGCKVNACGLQSQCIWVAKSMHMACKVNAYGLQSQCV
nr:PREDICTED: uncharacterized protein LOC107983746 [Anolis carolinensis]|eukprot:XP_016854156.1 PREDICTED: uncharacterized protein LOC107983746 [Anolis carolinensis]